MADADARESGRVLGRSAILVLYLYSEPSLSIILTLNKLSSSVFTTTSEVF